MAVDKSLHRATDGLIQSPRPRKYYRAAIPTQHWQLRSLVGSPKKNIVYYPSGEDVIRLNTRTREREIITTLSFSPKCLVAAGGWVCCGGDEGSYTAIFVGEKNPGPETPSRLDADAHARLPLDLEPPGRSTHHEPPPTTRDSRLHYPLFPSVKKLGTEITNCITLWFPPSNPSNSIYQIPVSVVAKNDCVVSILSLNDSEVIDNLEYPDFVNRAVISPDGKLLIAVCDDPFLYIHKRTASKPESKDGQSPKVTHYEWTLASRLQLRGQRHGDVSNMRGSFAAAFSKSGKYLAIATQHGIISVFETSVLTQERTDPLLTLFTSSRPNTHDGAVRAMEFAPGPFDLLAWTEAGGRVGVADVRDLFLSRQLFILDSHADGAERVLVSDRPGDAVIDPRLRNFRSDYPSSSSTPDYLGLDFERRQLRSLTREMLDRQQAPLTEEEMQVLQAHRVARRQRDAARDAVTSSSQSPSRWGPWADGQRPNSSSPATNEGATSAAERRTSTSNLPTALREFVSADRSAASFRAFVDRQNRERERREQTNARRRDAMSTVLATLENSLERETLATTMRADDNNASSSLERLTLSPSRLPPIGSDSPSSPWAETEALYRTRYLNGPPPDRAARLRVEVEDDDRRDFAHRLRQPWRPLDDLNRINLETRHESSLLRARRGNIETTGCCWSEDGTILYVGAEDGIYEYHVNVAARKVFPSLVLR